MIREVRVRLDLLYDGIESMRRDGLPVRAIAPQGAIYLSVQFDLVGRAPGCPLNFIVSEVPGPGCTETL